MRQPAAWWSLLVAAALLAQAADVPRAPTRSSPAGSRPAVRAPAAGIGRASRTCADAGAAPSAAAALRGGADDADGSLPQPREPAPRPHGKLPDPTEQPAESTPVGCWAVLRRIFSALSSLLVPKYDYAKVPMEILGDERQAGFAPDDESWRTARKKLHQVELGPVARKRVLRDLRILRAETDLGLEVEDSECLTDWIVKLVGAPNTVYAGEIYRLRVRFHADYPTHPPEVTFLRPAPVHEHIYSDGKICLNVLYNDWEPRMDIKSIALSLQSMMSSAKQKERPPDNNSTVVMSRGQKTRSMQWEFHDEQC